MIDETAENWTFADDEAQIPAGGATDAPALDEPWARQLEPELLMGFLSDFRGAMREKALAERATPGRGRDRVSSRLEAAREPEPWEINPYEGSDTQVTPEWWFATDGRWYPPELHPDRQVPVEPAPETLEPITGTVPEIPSETAPSAEPVGKDRAGRKLFLPGGGRKAGGFALEV
ncbi:MAG TPA: hypothetical protein VFJ79_05130 [Acidimicrobiales bacterium]|nr:hypothetical protein [Acidimicrobiales bacterium]